MTKLAWDQVGEKFYQTGVDRGVLYVAGTNGVYNTGVAWNGLTTVTESPSGGESNPQYADNIKYVDITSREDFGATIEAFTYPDQFAACDGSAEPKVGIRINQQARRGFGFSYRTLIGNDVLETDYGYVIHLVYGAKAKPTEKSRTTMNESPEAMAFSWEVTTIPVDVPGLKPTAHIEINSTKVSAAELKALEDILYGTAGSDPRLPLPAEVLGMFGSGAIVVKPSTPTYNSTTKTVTIPTVTGVTYYIDNKAVTGNVVLTKSSIVVARPNSGYTFPENIDNDWGFEVV